MHTPKSQNSEPSSLSSPKSPVPNVQAYTAFSPLSSSQKRTEVAIHTPELTKKVSLEAVEELAQEHYSPVRGRWRSQRGLSKQDTPHTFPDTPNPRYHSSWKNRSPFHRPCPIKSEKSAFLSLFQSLKSSNRSPWDRESHYVQFSLRGKHASCVLPHQSS